MVADSTALFCDRSVVFSTNKTNRHDITEILLKVASNTITLNRTNVIHRTTSVSKNYIYFV